ncbi:hypothetical protein GCM10018777_37510 [Streptomyces albogriseolus]|nr:hypothetical protein GCM10018777_37510 [Streptomyces viridodiastaticus]
MTSVPYWASTAAVARSAAVPVPQWLSASVTTGAGARMTQTTRTHRSVRLPASPVYVSPRVGSFSSYPDAVRVVSSGTVPP